MSRRRPIWPWFLSAFLLIALDQFTKYLVREGMQLHESFPVLGESFLRMTYVLNPGIAFGLDILGTVPLIVLGLTAAVLLAVYLFKTVRSGDHLRWPLLLFLSGAVGNTIDRIIYGKVTDFVDVDFPDFIMDRWPVFNVADSCVTIGIALMFVFVILDHFKSSAKPSEEKHVGFQSPSHSLSSDNRGRSETASD